MRTTKTNRERYSGYTSFAKMCDKKDEILKQNPNAKFLNGYDEKNKHFFEVEQTKKRGKKQ